MKTDIISAKNWIQTSKKGYDNRFDEFLTFLLEGGRVYKFVFFWARSDFRQKSVFLDNFLTKWVAVRPHGLIFNMEGSIFRARSDPSVNKNAPTSFLTKSDFSKNQLFG